MLGSHWSTVQRLTPALRHVLSRHVSATLSAIQPLATSLQLRNRIDATLLPNVNPALIHIINQSFIAQEWYKLTTASSISAEMNYNTHIWYRKQEYKTNCTANKNEMYKLVIKHTEQNASTLKLVSHEISTSQNRKRNIHARHEQATTLFILGAKYI